jgi:hypothetical protein
VELSGGHDGPRHRSVGDQPFLFTLSRVVGIALDRVDADDRQQNGVAHPGALFGGEQIPGAGSEVFGGTFPVRGWRADRVDDGLHAGERFVEAVTGHQVHPE